MVKDAKLFYQDFGVQGIKEVSDSSEYVADCPFCNKPQHFYFNENALYDCKVCHKKGNSVSFLKELHNKNGEINEILKQYGLHSWEYQKNDKYNRTSEIESAFIEDQKLINKYPERFEELVKIRKFKDAERTVYLMNKHKFCIDNLGNFIIPFFNFDGSVRGLLRYNPKGVVTHFSNGKPKHKKDEKGKPVTAMLTKNHKCGLWGYKNAYNNPEIHTIILCESPLKAFHLQLQGYDGGNGILAVGVSGAGNLPKDQIELFGGRKVIFCYDDDFNQEKTGRANPGQMGVLRDAKKISGTAKEIFNIEPIEDLRKKFENNNKWYEKVDLADDFWVEGGTKAEFEKYLEGAKVIEIPLNDKANNMPDDFMKKEKKFNPLKEAEIFMHDKHLTFLNEHLLMYDNGWYQKFDDRYYLKQIEDQLRENYYGRRGYSIEVLEVAKDNLYKKNLSVNVNPKLLNVKNGLLDINTLELKPHTPDLVYTYQINAKYDPYATCPNFEKYLDDVLIVKETLQPDREIQDVVQEFIGYCLYPAIPFHEAVILLGIGRNGKGVLCFTISELFKDLVSQIYFEDIGVDRFATSDLVDMLINISPEVSYDAKLNDGQIKAIIAGDKVRSQRKHQKAFDFRPFAKHIILTNNLPRSKDKSFGFFSRFTIIPFHRTFLANEEIENITDNKLKKLCKERDAFLEEKLKCELDGIFLWAVTGLKRLLENKRFTKSEQIEKYKSIFKIRSMSIETFCTEKLKTDDCTRDTELKDIYRTYIEYCRQMGIPSEKNKTFAGSLRNLGFDVTRGTENKVIVRGASL